MPNYRIHRMNGSGSLISRFDAIFAADDVAMAATEASLADGGQADIWDGSRFVRRVVVESQDTDDANRTTSDPRSKVGEVLQLLASGTRPAEIARRLKLSEATVYRIAAEEWANAAE